MSIEYIAMAYNEYGHLVRYFIGSDGYLCYDFGGGVTKMTRKYVAVNTNPFTGDKYNRYFTIKGDRNLYYHCFEYPDREHLSCYDSVKDLRKSCFINEGWVFSKKEIAKFLMMQELLK